MNTTCNHIAGPGVERLAAFPQKVYHRKPRDMWGNVLYPLNRLRDIAPDLYHRQRAKYDGRESLMQQRVVTLNCLWNDVLHLTPVHPAKIGEAARSEGLGWADEEWFEIDPAEMKFNSENTAIFRYSILDYGESMDPAEFEPFEATRLSKLTEIPQATHDYYRKMAAKDGRYLLFVGIPHVLHRGALNVELTPVVQA